MTEAPHRSLRAPRAALVLSLIAAACAQDAAAQSGAERLEREAVALMGARTPEARAAAAARFEEAAALHAQRGERRKEGIALLASATQHHFLGRPDRAAPLADSAVALLARHGHPIEAAEAMALRGEVHQSRGDAAPALERYRSALGALARAAQERLPPVARAYAARLDARLLSDIGNSFIELAMVDSAASYLERARSGRIAARDTLGLAVTLNNLGRLELTIGRTAPARALFAQSLAIAQDSADNIGEATTLANAGYSFDLESRPDSALAYQRRALDAAQRAGQASMIALTLINLGRNHLARVEGGLARTADGALTAAGDDLTVALQMKRTIGDSTGVAWALHDLGRVELAYGRREAAIAQLTRSREMLRASGDRVREASALLYLARAHAKGAGRERARALELFAETHAVRGTVGAQLGVDADRISYNEQDSQLTEEWVLAWLDSPEATSHGEILGALAAADLGRGRALLRLLRGQGKGVGAPEDLHAAGNALAAAVGRSGAQAALYCLVTRDKLWLWTLGPEGVANAVPVAVGRDSLTALTRTVRDEIDARAAGSPSAAMRALADALLPPAVRAALPRAGELVILPQGVLNLVPFAALPFGADGEPLGIRYALRYSPSLESLRQAAAGHDGVQPRLERQALRTALVVGNPAMPAVELFGLTNYRPSQLPWADSSSRTIAGLLGVERLNGPAASEAAVRVRLAQPAAIVHLETHGYAFQNEAQSQSSFVVLASGGSPAGQPTQQDGRLTIGEILNELPDLTAELVVLSACETGLGDLKQAEGSVGLQRAFLAKKARTVLVSLWSVDDRASAQIAVAFYRHWLDGKGTSKAEALRQAQLEVRTLGSGDPYLWAAFQLVGAG